MFKTVKTELKNGIKKTKNEDFKEVILKSLDLTKLVVSMCPIDINPILVCFDLIEGFYELQEEFKNIPIYKYKAASNF